MKTSLLRTGAAVAIVVALLGAAACGGGDSDRAQMTAALAGITSMDLSGFHEIDTEITQNGKIPATAHTTALHIQAVALTTDWPKEFKTDAGKLAALMGDFAAAIDTDAPDMKKAVDASNKAHAAWHDFSKLVWSHIEGEAGLKADANETHGH